jgi:prepilin-type processing-associated H-X9-DG protein
MALLVENFRAAREVGKRRVGEWANSLSDTPDLNAKLWAHPGTTNVLFFDAHIEAVTLASFPPADRNESTIKTPAWMKRFSGFE